MNKFIPFFIIISLFFGTILANETTLEETKKTLNGDPYKIAEWMKNNIRPVDDSIGFGQLPERTFKYKKGDCEDYAILSQYFIGDKYETYVVAWYGKFKKDSNNYKRMKNKRIGHAVLAIKINENKWGIIDLDRYITGGKTLAEMVKINCELRKVVVDKAYIMDLLKLRRKVIKEIDLNEENF